MTDHEVKHVDATAGKVIVYGLSFLEALGAAVVFTDKDHSTVRVDLDPEAVELTITAGVIHQPIAVTAPAQWMNIINLERDLAFELTAKQVADVLQVFKWKRTSDMELDEQPLIGISLRDGNIAWFDESGLGLGLEVYGCLRYNHERPEHIAQTIDAAFTELPGDRIQLTEDQLGAMKKVAKVIGVHPTFLPLETSKYLAARTLISAGPFRSIATVSIEATSEDEQPTDPEELTFEDHTTTGTDDKDQDTTPHPETTPRAGLHVVGANPTKGIS